MRRACARLANVLPPHGKDTELVSISVQDQGSPSDPTALPVDVDDEEFWLAESGRGLWTISRTAHSWGWFGNPTPRTVTALFTPEPEKVG